LPEIVSDLVSKSSAAAALGVSPARVTQLIAEGLPVEPRGRISLAKAKAWCADNLDGGRARAGGGGKTGAATRVRIELDRVRVERARLELEKARGALVDRKAAEAAIFARARAERDAHLAWVVRVAPTVAVQLGVDGAELQRLLELEMRQHLEELACRALAELT